MFNIEEEIRKAKEDGVFQGKVLSQLAQVAETLKIIESKHTIQDADIKEKADKDIVDALASKVEFLQKIAYVGIGGLGVVQIAIAFFK